MASAASRRLPPPHHRKSPQRKLSHRTILVLLSILVLGWFLVLHESLATYLDVEQEVPQTPVSQSGQLQTATVGRKIEQNDNGIHQVSCNDLWARARNKTDDSLKDINAGMGDAANRHTITDPPFWICLHKEWYDPLRWTSIMNQGQYYEHGITEQFKTILGGANRGIVIDVGMNIGWFSLWARTLGHNVVAFEPNPQNHLRMCDSLKLNGWDKDGSVGLYQYGVGDAKGSLTLQWGKNPGKATFHADRLAKKTEKTSIDVTVTTLDDAAADILSGNNEKLPIHLLKVDVEGHELPVFRGGQQLIKTGRIKNVLMEWSSTSKEEIAELFTILLGAGYELHLMSGGTGQPIYQEETAKIKSVKVTDSLELSTQLKNIDSELDYLAKVDHALNLWWIKN